jgi:hypothetical protein
MSENSDKAASKIEERVSQSSNNIDDAVRRDIDEALKTNNISTTQDLQQVGRRLEQDKVLPTMLLKEEEQLFTRYSTDGQNLDTNKLRTAAGDTNESPYNRLLAQAMYDRVSAMDTNSDRMVSRTELQAWANNPAQTDAAGNTVTVDGSNPNNPDKITRTNVNGETETIERSGNGYIVRRTNADGSTYTGEAKNLVSDGNGGYTYETSGSKVTYDATNGTRTVENTKTGDKTVVTYDKEGDISKLEYTDKSGRISETITSDGKNPPSYRLTVHPNGAGNVEIKNVNFKGDSYSYQSMNGTTYEQELDRDNRTVTSPDGKQVTRYNFGDDGKPTYIATEYTNPDGTKSRVEVKPNAEGVYEFHEPGKPPRALAEQPSVWYGGYKMEFAPDAEGNKESLMFLNDGSKEETLTTADGTKKVIRQNADGSGKFTEEKPDGTKKTFEVDAENNVTKVEHNNGTETTVIERQPDGSYTKVVKTNDGSKPDTEPVTVSDVKADGNGNYSYKQEVGPNGRKFTYDQDGNASYEVRPWSETGDCLWAIASDILQAQGGEPPTNAQIWEMINKMAQASGIADPNRIGIGQQITIPG